MRFTFIHLLHPDRRESNPVTWYPCCDTTKRIWVLSCHGELKRTTVSQKHAITCLRTSYSRRTSVRTAKIQKVDLPTARNPMIAIYRSLEQKRRMKRELGIEEAYINKAETQMTTPRCLCSSWLNLDRYHITSSSMRILRTQRHRVQNNDIRFKKTSSRVN